MDGKHVNAPGSLPEQDLLGGCDPFDLLNLLIPIGLVADVGKAENVEQDGNQQQGSEQEDLS